MSNDSPTPTEQPDVAALDFAVKAAHTDLGKLLRQARALEQDDTGAYYTELAAAETVVAEVHEARDHVADAMTAASFRRFAAEDEQAAEKYRSMAVTA